MALSNHRLVAMGDRGVTFCTKTAELVTLDGVTFLDRWLGHVLPYRFRKVRHYGLLAPSHVTDRLARARHLLPVLATIIRYSSHPSVVMMKPIQ